LATGVIKDAATGKPLSAVSVSVEDFSAALTDDKGNFSIRVPNYYATLIIKGQGLQTKEVPLRGQKQITTSLYEESFNSIYDEVQLPFGAKAGNKAVQSVASVNVDGNWGRNGETPDGFYKVKLQA